MKGTLYIVSTPIGNLEDITVRALRVLRDVDIIATEDTRHTLKLLNHYGIAKPMISYWSGKEKARAQEIIERLLSGKSVALISDAGTPGISDPGSVVISNAIEEHIHRINLFYAQNAACQTPCYLNGRFPFPNQALPARKRGPAVPLFRARPGYCLKSR